MKIHFETYKKCYAQNIGSNGVKSRSNEIQRTKKTGHFNV